MPAAWAGDVRGADAVAVGDGGQPLDVACRAAGEITSVSASHSWGNSWATWATGQWCWHSWPPVRDRRRGGSVALGGQRLGQRLGPGERLVAGAVDRPPAALLERGDPAPGELGDRLLAAGLGDEAQRRGGQVVVRLRGRSAPAGVGEREHLRRAAAAARGRGRSARGRHAPSASMVEVPADRGRAQAQRRRRARRRWPRPARGAAGDPVPGAAVGAAPAGGRRQPARPARRPVRTRYQRARQPCFSQHQCYVFRRQAQTDPPVIHATVPGFRAPNCRDQRAAA